MDNDHNDNHIIITMEKISMMMIRMMMMEIKNIDDDAG